MRDAKHAGPDGKQESVKTLNLNALTNKNAIRLLYFRSINMETFSKTFKHIANALFFKSKLLGSHVGINKKNLLIVCLLLLFDILPGFSASNCPAIKIGSKSYGTLGAKTSTQYLRMTLPVKCSDKYTPTKPS